MQDMQNYLSNTQKSGGREYKILRNINVEKLNKFSNNNEINAIWTYLNFFEREYLGLLSEQNLRLDYGHSYQRDKFFILFNQTIRTIEDYGRTLEQIQTASSIKNNEYKDELIKVQSKEYRNVIIKSGKFLNAVQDFIDEILKTEKGGQKVLLEPDKIVEIKGEESNIAGLTARKALMDLYQFILEFIDFLKIPDLKKISEEDVE